MRDQTCGRGTFNGAAAEASPYRFAPCILDREHPGPCDSGRAPEPDQPSLPFAA